MAVFAPLLAELITPNNVEEEGLLTGMGKSPAPWFAGETRDRYHACWSRGLTGGVNYYPYRNRSWRINAHYIHIVRSPTGSFFGYYTAGQTGTTISFGTDILL